MNNYITKEKAINFLLGLLYYNKFKTEVPTFTNNFLILFQIFGFLNKIYPKSRYNLFPKILHPGFERWNEITI
jgi:hypothetical protein